MEMREKTALCAIRRNKLIANATREEIIFMRRLEAVGVHYMFQKGLIAGKNFCIADFYLPRPNRIVIEIDGDYHLTKEQIARDKNKDWYYRQRGFSVVRIKNEDVTTFDISLFIKKKIKSMPTKKKKEIILNCTNLEGAPF